MQNGKGRLSHAATIGAKTLGQRRINRLGESAALQNMIVCFQVNRPNDFFNISETATPGLHALVHKPDTSFESLIVPTRVEGLAFLPRGQRLSHGENGNVQKPLQEALTELRKRYDVIFIDTPPLFTSNLAHQWAALADLIVVVARIFVTRPRDVIEAIQTCKLYSRAPVGVALNCVPLTGAYRRASNYYFSKKKSKPHTIAA